MASEISLFNQIWKNVFKTAPVLPQDAVLEVFTEMDELLRGSINLIGRSPVVIDQIMGLTADVVGSLSHGRGIFARGAMIEKVAKSDKEKKPSNVGVSWNVDPGKVFRYRNRPDLDALAFIGSSLRLMAASNEGKVTPDDLWNVRLSRASYEVVIESFLQKAASYEALSIENAKARHRYMQATNWDRIGKHVTRVSSTNEAMVSIEQEVGFSEDLFGILIELKYRHARYQRLRDKVYIPYLRIAFNEAKKRATTENQTIDNFQNGAEGLMDAVSNYNPRRGVFSSYAKMWTTQRILIRLKEEANPIKLPAAVWQTASKLNEIAQRHASMSHDGSFDPEEVALEAGIDSKRAERIFERIRSTQMLSIDYQTSDDPDAQSMHETIEASDGDEIPDVTQFLAALPESQRFYMELHFGLWDMLPGSLPSDPEVLARERLRQTVAFGVKEQLR